MTGRQPCSNTTMNHVNLTQEENPSNLFAYDKLSD